MKLERKWKNKKKKRKKEKEGRKKLLPSGGIREWGRLFLLLYKCIPKVVSDGFTKREEVRLVLGLGFSEIVERDEMRTRGTFSGREMRQWFEGQNIVAIDEWWQTSHRSTGKKQNNGNTRRARAPLGGAEAVGVMWKTTQFISLSSSCRLCALHHIYIYIDNPYNPCTLYVWWLISYGNAYPHYGVPFDNIIV